MHCNQNKHASAQSDHMKHCAEPRAPWISVNGRAIVHRRKIILEY